MPRQPTGKPRGRPRGPGKLTGPVLRRENARKLAEELAGLSPDEIDVMSPLDAQLRMMRGAWRIGDFLTVERLARDAGPYIHARLSSTQLDANISLFDKLGREQQRALVEALAAIPEDADPVASGIGATVN